MFAWLIHHCHSQSLREATAGTLVGTRCRIQEGKPPPDSLTGSRLASSLYSPDALVPGMVLSTVGWVLLNQGKPRQSLIDMPQANLTQSICQSMLSSQMTLGCVKLTIEAESDKMCFSNTLLLSRLNKIFPSWYFLLKKHKTGVNSCSLSTYVSFLYFLCSSIAHEVSN